MTVCLAALVCVHPAGARLLDCSGWTDEQEPLPQRPPAARPWQRHGIRRRGSAVAAESGNTPAISALRAGALHSVPLHCHSEQSRAAARWLTPLVCCCSLFSRRSPTTPPSQRHSFPLDCLNYPLQRRTASADQRHRASRTLVPLLGALTRPSGLPSRCLRTSHCSSCCCRA